MASQELPRPSLYPDVDLSNPNPNPNPNPSMYPTLDMSDLVSNLFPDDYRNPSPHPSAPPTPEPEPEPQPVEETLLTVPGSIIHLIDKDYSVELAVGDFSVVRLRQGENIVAVLARVSDEVQWPLIKDEAIVKVDSSHYFFSFPGEDSDDPLNYGLSFASRGQEGKLKQLDGVFDKYGNFSVQKVSEQSEREMVGVGIAREISPEELKKDGGKREIMERNCGAYWTTLAPNVEEYSGTTAKLIAQGSGQVVKGILWCGDVTIDRLKWGHEVLKRRMDPGEKKEVDQKTLKRIKRVKKMTKMTKKVANGVLSGVVRVSGFFTSSVVNSKAGKKFFSLLPGEMVLASLDGFSRFSYPILFLGTFFFLPPLPFVPHAPLLHSLHPPLFLSILTLHIYPFFKKKKENKIKPNPSMKTMTRYNSIPACFRPPPPPPTPATATSSANLATSLYQTHLGIFSLTWSRAFLTRSLHLHLHPHPHLGLSPAVFHLSLNPLLFWNHRGHKKLPVSPSQSVWVFWDLARAKFGPGPGPESGFYIAVLHEGQMALLVGDLEKEAYNKTRLKGSGTDRKGQSLVLRREHVIGRRDRLYTTKVDLGGRSRLVSIELNENCEDGPKLEIRFDQTRVVEVKHLKWKFRGSERIEVDGELVMLSWDVYNWLFEVEDSNQDDGCALFTFRFEQQGTNVDVPTKGNRKGERVNWSQDSCGLNYERKKMKKKLMVKSRSPSFSSSSTSSVSSAGSNSVLEWESVEENELKGPTGFSLLVYAWKS